jgi:hypothetical protein
MAWIIGAREVQPTDEDELHQGQPLGDGRHVEIGADFAAFDRATQDRFPHFRSEFGGKIRAADERHGQLHVFRAHQYPHDRVLAAMVDEIDQPFHNLIGERVMAEDERSCAFEQHPRTPLDQRTQ